MAVKDQGGGKAKAGAKTKGGAKAKAGDIKRPLPKKPARSGPQGPVPADRLNALAFVGTLSSWICLLLGQRVLDAEEGLAKMLTALGVLGLVVCFGQRMWAATTTSSDRRASARAFALLSGLGVLAMALYFAGSAWGRDVLGVETPAPGDPDNFGDITTVAYVTLLTVSVLPSILGELGTPLDGPR